MSCNSAIYTVNNSNPAIATTPGVFVNVPLGSVIRRFGRNLALDGNSIQCYGSGYYDVEASVSMVATAAGIVTAQLYQDGVAVPGALASATATAGGTVNLGISALVRNCGCDCNSVLTIAVDAAGSVSNLSVVVEKI